MTTKAADGRRRGRGSGGVQQRDKAGRVWRLWYDAPPGADGKRRRRSETLHGKRVQAEQRLRAILGSIDTGEFVEQTEETTADYLARWLDMKEGSGTSPRTMKDYRGLVTRYMVPMIGTTPLMKLRPDQVQQMYSDLLSRGKAPRTVLHVHRLLYQALKQAVRWQILMRNPCQAVEPPVASHTEMRTLAREQRQTFMDAIDGSPYRDVYYMDLYTGLRRSEILGLRWPQVDTEHGAVSIVAALHRLPGQGLVLLAKTKTKSSRRRVDVPETVVDVLHEIRAGQMLSASETGLEWHTDGYVFAWPDGRPFDPDMITHDFRTRMDRAGLHGLRFHDLRHSFASLMLAAGEQPKVVQAALGHSSIMVTMDVYGHLMPGAGREAARRLAEYIDAT